MQTTITVFLIMFNIFSAIDTAQTVYLIEKYGIEGECNPVAKYVYQKTGKYGYIGLDIATTFFVNYYILKQKDEHPTHCLIIIMSLTATKGMVVGLNFKYNF